MMDTQYNQKTICAVSTAPGMGGIAVIRISGDNAIAITDSVFHAHKTLASAASHTATFGRIIDDNNNIIDEVIATIFRAPHSFTGEDTVEVSCHGSVYIQNRIVALLIAHGASAAGPGEFTQRAFANGKMDLSQAEAVADLIASSSAASHRLAISQMRGDFSNHLSQLRAQLLDFVSLMELELDFSEEDVEFADRSRLITLAQTILADITHLSNSFEVGNAIKNGIPVVIAGETNAGKSTLLNRLVHDDRALVSDIHGTTRDVIEDVIVIGGILFRFIDTAGIRQTTDQVESMGIERTFAKAEQARILLWIIDAQTPIADITTLGKKMLSLAQNKKLILVFNKEDLITADSRNTLTAYANSLPQGTEHIFVSAKRDSNISTLEQLLVHHAQYAQAEQSDIIVTNARHYEALTRAGEALTRALTGLQTHISGDFVSQDIREAMYYLGTITGEITPSDILGSIFSKFCIGK